MEQKRFIISPLEERKMIKFIVGTILMAYVITWNTYYIKTKDTSIQGYIEYLKEKYYYKKKD